MVLGLGEGRTAASLSVNQNIQSDVPSVSLPPNFPVGKMRMTMFRF